ncbi:MAG: flavodoxin family protein, partial [Pseudomonadota bacterium]
CSVTTGAPEVSFEKGGRGGEVCQILWSTQYSLYYMGFEVLNPHVSYGVQGHGYSYANDQDFLSQMEKSKEGWARRLENIENEEPISFPGWKDWDDMGRPKYA